MGGAPDKEALRKIPHERCRSFIESQSQTTQGGRTLAEAVQSASRDALDLINRTLRFSPDKRCTVGQALEHKYLTQLHCPDDEPTRGPLDSADFEFERRKVDMNA